MLDALRGFIAENELIPKNSRVLVGFSGGADSTCLLHLLASAGFEVVAAHLNHLQRPEAEEHEHACAAFAQELGVPFVSGRADVPGLANDLKIGLEEAGRQARYAFFDEAASQSGCDLIATAHTQSDSAETVLLNLARGTGLAGLAGIPLQRGHVIRPLLFATREQTENYCREHALPTLHDSTNDDPSFARVKVRRIVLPGLVDVHPHALEAIGRLTKIVREEDRFLDAAAAAALEKAEIPLNGSMRFLTLDAEAAFDRPYLLHLPPVLLRRALRLVATALGAELDFGQVEQAVRGLVEEEKGSVTSEKGTVVFTWNTSQLHVSRNVEEESFKEPLPVPGETRRPEHGWRLLLTVEDARMETPRREALAVQIDPDAFRGPLHFRSLQPGDEVLPLGGIGHRKLSDLMSEAGLTLMARRRLPILCDIIGPLWAPGVVLAERARLASHSGKTLRADFGPILGEAGKAETEAAAQAYANS